MAEILPTLLRPRTTQTGREMAYWSHLAPMSTKKTSVRGMRRTGVVV